LEVTESNILAQKFFGSFFQKRTVSSFLPNDRKPPMSRIAYVNGAYRPLADAAVHIEDRGFQFADGVYEVIYRHAGRLVDMDLHLARLQRSLRELSLALPATPAALNAILTEVARRNRLESGLFYIQVSRGCAPRLHCFPPPGTKPTLVVTMRGTAPFPTALDHWQAAAITMADQRWARCDIKSVSLLPNVLAREAARRAGALEAILHDADGIVTEGASTSVFIVDAAGTLRTRPLGPEILPGCTRDALLSHLADSGIPVETRAFSLQEMRAAREIFITAATTFVKPVTRLDGAPVGDGMPGPVAERLFAWISGHITGRRNVASA
jgi:D-alanine transaminase